MEEMKMSSVPIPHDLASDPRFMRAAPEVFMPYDVGYAPARRAGPLPAEPPPPGLRTGSTNQIRESVSASLHAQYGVQAPSADPEPTIGRTGGVDRIRESVRIGLDACYGNPVQSNLTYKSGKHVRSGDVLEAVDKSLYRVSNLDESGATLNHMMLGEMRVGQKFLSHCLLVKRAKK